MGFLSDVADALFSSEDEGSTDDVNAGWDSDTADEQGNLPGSDSE